VAGNPYPPLLAPIWRIGEECFPGERPNGGERRTRDEDDERYLAEIGLQPMRSKSKFEEELLARPRLAVTV